MALDSVLRGVASGHGAEVDGTTNRLLVQLADDPNVSGAIVTYYERDEGLITGAHESLSPFVDDAKRLATGWDTVLDTEVFNYTSQNTSKFSIVANTYAPSWNAQSMKTNSTNLSTALSGMTGGTYAFFPQFSDAEISLTMEAGFDVAHASLSTTAVIDFGIFPRGLTYPYAPLDGLYFRVTQAGVQGVLNYNGVESIYPSPSTYFPIAFGSLSPFQYITNNKHQWKIITTTVDVDFIIDGVVYAVCPTLPQNGQPYGWTSLPISWRHIQGASTGGIAGSFSLANYNLKLVGSGISRRYGELSNAIGGSYQGQSGNTMGTAALYGVITTGNEANPTAAVATNTTAALGSGLGGHFWETATLAVNTDGILQSFQVPAAVAGIRGKRLRISGIWLSSYIQTVIAGGPFIAQYSLAFGHTAVSLATTETAATKAPRRIPLPPMTQNITAAQAVSTQVAQPGGGYMLLDNPIYVNPGEFVQIITRHIGTVATAGTIAHNVMFDYSWE